MMVYRHPDGTEYKVADGQEPRVIQMLRKEMFTDPGSNKKYMEGVCNIVAEMFGVWISADDEKEFLEALVSLRILDKIEK